MTLGARAGGLLLLLVAGCDCGTPASSGPGGAAEEDDGAVIPGALIGSTWPLLMADNTARAPFEGRPGWSALVMQRDYPAALADFSAEPALSVGQGRVHLELASAYRQATLVAAQATLQVWNVERRDEDPPEVGCLVGLAQLILAQDAVSALEGCAGSVQGPVAEHAAAWAAWLQAGAVWPPTAPLATTPGLPAEGALAGGLPDGGTLPQYDLHDLVEGLPIEAASPMTLLGLALYHEDAALAALPGMEGAVAAWLAPWRLPVEPRQPIPEGAVPLGLLFGSPLLVPDDALFLADLTRGQGLPAVAAWSGSSALAAAIEPCLGAGAAGGVGGTAGPDPACAVERANGAAEQLDTALRIRTGGELGFRPFVEIGRLGVVRAAEWAAAAAGDEKSMGILRLYGIDLSVGPAAEPQYLLSITAWDAHNKNTARATETLHAQVGHIPGVEVARFPLDALHVRLSRESAPGVPMH